MITRLYKQRHTNQSPNNRALLLALKKISILLFLLLAPNVSHAEIYKINFVTDSQTIGVNELSGPITIQTQDSNSAIFQTPETIDLEFVSSSNSGEFLGSSGNPATKTMSVNTANRTFYYKDSSAGTFTLTINATGRVSGERWTASQKISVGNGQTGTQLVAQTGDRENESTTSVGSGTRTSSPDASIEIYSISDRVTSVGSPLEFRGVLKKNSTSSGRLEFNWSFGDGTTGFGQTVFHTYEYSGEYVCVLDVKAGGVHTIERFKVKVTDPEVTVRASENFLEIFNNGNSEINLFNWKIENDGKGFVFQPDTILLPHSSIKINKKLLSMNGMDGTDLKLKNTFGQIVFSKPADPDWNEIKDKLSQISSEAQMMQSRIALIPERNVLEERNQLASSSEANVATTSLKAEKVLFEVPKNQSIVSKLTNIFKKVFSR